MEIIYGFLTAYTIMLVVGPVPVRLFTEHHRSCHRPHSKWYRPHQTPNLYLVVRYFFIDGNFPCEKSCSDMGFNYFFDSSPQDCGKTNPAWEINGGTHLHTQIKIWIFIAFVRQNWIADEIDGNCAWFKQIIWKKKNWNCWDKHNLDIPRHHRIINWHTWYTIENFSVAKFHRWNFHLIREIKYLGPSVHSLYVSYSSERKQLGEGETKTFNIYVDDSEAIRARGKIKET